MTSLPFPILQDRGGETFAAAAGKMAGIASDNSASRVGRAGNQSASLQNPLVVTGNVGAGATDPSPADANAGNGAPPRTDPVPDPFPPLQPGEARLLVSVAAGKDFPEGAVPSGWRRIQVIPLGTALIKMTLDGPRLQAPITYEVEPPPPGVTYRQQLFTGLPPGASYMVTALCLNAAGKKLASGFKNNIDLALGNNALNLPMALEPFDAGLIY